MYIYKTNTNLLIYIVLRNKNLSSLTKNVRVSTAASAIIQSFIKSVIGIFYVTFHLNLMEVDG